MAKGVTTPVLLRSALDWLTILSLCPVTRATWDHLARLADVKAGELLGSSAGALPMTLRRIGRDIIASSVGGVRVLIREPSASRLRDVACAPARRGDLTVDALGSCQGADEGPRGDLTVDALGSCQGADEGRCSAPVSVVSELGGMGLRRVGGEDVRAVYGVESQIQGTAWSSVTHGGEGLAWAIWEAICSWIYADRGGADAVEPMTRAGRADITHDTAFVGGDAAAYVEEQVYANGNHDACFAPWSTRSRKRRSESTATDVSEGDAWVPLSGRRSLLGKAVAGRTSYVGSSEYVLCCVYERSKKTDGDWSVLAPTLRACGWDGDSPVIRTEFRVSRRWLGDQVLTASDGRPMFPRPAPAEGEPAGLRADELTIRQFLAALPALAAEAPSRMRHTDPSQNVPGGPRLRDRRSSAWWQVIEEGARAWVPGGVGDVGRVVSTRRLAAADRTLGAVRTGLMRLVALTPGARDLADVMPKVREAWRAKEFADQRDAIIARTRARYGITDDHARRAMVA